MISKYEITWTDFAEKQLDLIFDYYLVEAGYGVALKIIQSLVSRVEILKSFPETGQIELSLYSHPNEFRYLLDGNYKIIYHLTDNSVVIIDVFDTRRDPIKIERGLEY